jgi:hypothetical protein
MCQKCFWVALSGFSELLETLFTDRSGWYSQGMALLLTFEK